MTEPQRLTLGRALAELERRNDDLAARDLREPDPNMQPVEAIVPHTQLNEYDIRTAAELVAMRGRKAQVTLVVLVPGNPIPRLDLLGGSPLLLDFARAGRSVRLVNEAS